MKILILIFGCLLPFVPCQAAENQPVQEKQNQQQLAIEKYISRLQGEIENYYADRLIELKQRAEAEIRLLEIADKPVYASLAAHAQVAKAVLHIDYGYRAPYDFATGTERMLQHEPYSYFKDIKDKITKSPKQFAAAQSRIAERKSRVLAHLEFVTLNLERQKQYALTVGLAQLEKRLKEDALKPQPQTTHGLVTGILYSGDKPSAIIDREIVHNGDAIYGVTVVKIHKDKVEFEKSGRKWEQKVQQKPEAYWK